LFIVNILRKIQTLCGQNADFPIFEVGGV